MTEHSKFSTFLREPLFHFLLIGAGIFFLYAELASTQEDEKDKIIITKEKIDTLALAFSQENGRQPVGDEIQKKLDNDIKDEVLYREAMAIELDKDDRIIRRRLIEKMKYLFEDLMFIEDPSDEELKRYFQNNRDTFMESSGVLPEYSKIKDHVKREWTSEQQKKSNETFYEDIKSRYEIIINDEVRKDAKINVGVE